MIGRASLPASKNPTRAFLANPAKHAACGKVALLIQSEECLSVCLYLEALVNAFYVCGVVVVCFHGCVVA